MDKNWAHITNAVINKQQIRIYYNGAWSPPTNAHTHSLPHRCVLPPSQWRLFEIKMWENKGGSRAQRKPSPAVCSSVLNIKWRPDDLSLCLSSSDTSSLGVTPPMKGLICSQQGLLPVKSGERRKERKKKQTLRHVSYCPQVNMEQSAVRRHSSHKLSDNSVLTLCAIFIFICVAVCIKRTKSVKEVI